MDDMCNCQRAPSVGELDLETLEKVPRTAGCSIERRSEPPRHRTTGLAPQGDEQLRRRCWGPLVRHVGR
jgi:hypothetical protein